MPEPQLLGVPKIRYLPSLLRSTSSSFDGEQSKEFHHTARRPFSPASTSSSRRSVSAMKQLLPLKLQPSLPLPNVDLSSWLDDTAPILQPDTTRLHSRQGSQYSDHIPWMLSPQDLQLMHDIHPRKYRETPIYSKRGSSILLYAYLGEESSCSHYPITGPCDELCIVSNYEDDSSSHASSADCTEGFNDKNRSVESSPISNTSTRVSELSIQCQGDQINKDCSTLSRFDFKQSPDSCIDKVADVSGQNGNGPCSYALEGWIDSDCSRSSSPSGDNDVFDAFITKLAPTKASVVELIRSPQIALDSFPRPTSPCQNCPSTSTSFRGKPEESPVALISTPRKAFSSEGKASTVSQRPARVFPSIFGHDGGFENTMPHAHLKRPSAQSPACQSGIINQLPQPFRINEEELHDNIIDAIRKAVRSFPQDMLLLDTPCVIQIRCQSHPSHQSTPLLQNLSSHSQESAGYRPPSSKSQISSFRRTTMATSIPTSLKRHHSIKDASRELEAVSVTSTIKPPPYTPMVPEEASESEDISSPDITAFRKIFPSTDDWWRDVLYAHFVTYNYIQDIKVQPKPSIPSKIYHTLGIPRCTPSRVFPSELQDQLLGDLESDLASCINRVINCMAGKSNALRDTDEIRQVEKDDGLLVRALAEIVRVCEMGHRQEILY